MNRKTFLLFLLSSACLCVIAQMKPGKYSYADEDPLIYQRYVEAMDLKHSLMAGDLIVETARFFLGRPYVAATLEHVPEGLIVNLREMDCMTLVEATMALTRSLKRNSFNLFCEQLKNIRYRNSGITDYTDRLHYTTDWIYENERKGLLKDMTREIGGKPLALELSFMSTHPDSYKQLKDNPGFVSKIADKEKEINTRPHYYIPTSEINAHASDIQNGDIVCFVTTIRGLDISHVGIICREVGKLTFIHASISHKQVIINEEPLQEYVQSIKRNKGIMIIRPQF